MDCLPHLAAKSYAIRRKVTDRSGFVSQSGKGTIRTSMFRRLHMLEEEMMAPETMMPSQSVCICMKSYCANTPAISFYEIRIPCNILPGLSIPYRDPRSSAQPSSQASWPCPSPSALDFGPHIPKTFVASSPEISVSLLVIDW